MPIQMEEEMSFQLKLKKVRSVDRPSALDSCWPKGNPMSIGL